MLRAVLLLLGMLVATQAVAQSKRPSLYFDGAPPWVMQSATVRGATIIDLDFANGRFFPSYSLGAIAVTRASVAEEDGADGVWYPFATGQLRFTSRGALIEESRTNSIRNSTMVGAVAGSPGTVPTNWNLNVPTGLTRTLALSTVKGLACISVNYAGTTSSTAPIAIQADTNPAIAASYGQTWTGSFYMQVTQDDPAITGLNGNTQTLNAVPAVIDNAAVGLYANRLSFLRESVSVTGSTSAVATVRHQISTNSINSGITLNFTELLCAPQLERVATIAGTVAAAAVNAAGTGYGNTLTGTMTWASGGTCAVAPVLNVTTTAGGAIATVNSVTNVGGCGTFPTAAATWTPGGGLSAGTGATFTLTPTNNAALAAASSLILTTSAAATRAADVVTMPLAAGLTSPSGFGMLAVATPIMPNLFNSQQNVVQVDDGTSNQRSLSRRAATTASLLVSTVGGTGQAFAPAGTWQANTQGKITYWVVPAGPQAVFNNGVISTAAAITLPNPPNTLRIGSGVATSAAFNGYFSRVVLSNASLIGN